MDLNNLNDNIITQRWKERYATLSEETKEKLSAFKKMNPSEYQLQVIKRKRIYPEIGDIFELKTRHNVVIKGVVINNHIDNINGNDLILIFIFKMEIDILECLQNGNVYDSLLCMPKIVGSEYWSKGYFFNKNPDLHTAPKQSIIKSLQIRSDIDEQSEQIKETNTVG